MDGVDDDVLEGGRRRHGASKPAAALAGAVPLAMPVIIAGLRIATVSSIALVTIAALIGRGGFGQFILDGLNTFFWTPLIVGVGALRRVGVRRRPAAARSAAARDTVGRRRGRETGGARERAARGPAVARRTRQLVGRRRHPDSGAGSTCSSRSIALAIAALIAVPIGLWIGHTRRGQFSTVQFANVGRSIPSLAVLSIAFLLAVKELPTLAFGFLPTTSWL